MSYSVIVNIGTLAAVGALLWYMLRKRRDDQQRDTEPPAQSDEAGDQPEA